MMAAEYRGGVASSLPHWSVLEVQQHSRQLRCWMVAEGWPDFPSKHVLSQVSLEKSSAAVWVQSPSQLNALSLAPTLADAVKSIGFECEPHIEGL